MGTQPTSYDAIGSGTASNPYVLCNAAQLVALSGAPAAWKKAFRLGSDIDLMMNGSGSASPFTMLGTTKQPFSGTFDGAGHVVSNLSLSLSNTTDVGFFGLLQGGAAEVRNLNFTGASVVGSANVGIVVGRSERGARILRCSSEGSVQADNSVGGILGYGNLGPLVSSSASSAKVTSTGKISWAGGIAGQLSQGVFIFNSYATGPVAGDNNTGGLVGSIDSGGVFNSYATGTVTSTGASADGVGGFVGGVHGTIYQNCFATGDVTAASSTGVGRFAGEAPYGTFNNNFNLSTSMCQMGSGTCPADTMGVAKGVALSQLQDKSQLPTSAWDFSKTWTAASGQLPSLDSVLFDATTWDGCAMHATAMPVAGGDGTPDRPYLICTAAQFAALGATSSLWDGVYVQQMASIDFSTANVTLKPIGAQGNLFVGVYNGNGKLLSNVTLNASSGMVGLFGMMTGTLLRMGVVNGTVTAGAGAQSVGMLVGNLYGALDDSYATGSVTGPTSVGGLGNAHTMAGCYASVTVKATGGPAGGLNASGGNDGVVYDVFASSDVSAPSGMAYNLTPPVNGSSQVVDGFYDNTKCSGCQPIDAMGQPTSYFYSPTSAPMSNWDFDTIWMAQPGAFPTLR
jgi:hypothetical protein